MEGAEVLLGAFLHSLGRARLPWRPVRPIESPTRLTTGTGRGLPLGASRSSWLSALSLIGLCSARIARGASTRAASSHSASLAVRASASSCAAPWICSGSSATTSGPIGPGRAWLGIARGATSRLVKGLPGLRVETTSGFKPTPPPQPRRPRWTFRGAKAGAGCACPSVATRRAPRPGSSAAPRIRATAPATACRG